MTITKDLRALTLVGPTRENPVLNPLAVLHLDNCLYMSRTVPKDKAYITQISDILLKLEATYSLCGSRHLTDGLV